MKFVKIEENIAKIKIVKAYLNNLLNHPALNLCLSHRTIYQSRFNHYSYGYDYFMYDLLVPQIAMYIPDSPFDKMVNKWLLSQ